MKAIIFDMDGTLINSMPAWNELNEAFLASYGISRDEVDYDMFITQGLGDIIASLEEEFGISVDKEEVFRRSMNKMEAWYRDAAIPCPGVKQMLKELQGEGIRLVVGTATRYEMALAGLERAGILDAFEWVYSSSLEGYDKNDKRFFQAILKKLDLPAEEVALFDDALYSIVTARECGIYTLAVEDPTYPQDLDQMARQADEFVRGFEDFDVQRWLHDLA